MCNLLAHAADEVGKGWAVGMSQHTRQTVCNELHTLPGFEPQKINRHDWHDEQDLNNGSTSQQRNLWSVFVFDYAVINRQRQKDCNHGLTRMATDLNRSQKQEVKNIFLPRINANKTSLGVNAMNRKALPWIVHFLLSAIIIAICLSIFLRYFFPAIVEDHSLWAGLLVWTSSFVLAAIGVHYTSKKIR